LHSPSAYEVRPVTLRATRRLIEGNDGADAQQSLFAPPVHRGHYLGAVYSGGDSFGLYVAGEMVGVAIFGPPVRENVARSLWDGGTLDNTRELTRFYTLDDLAPNTGTWFLARTVALLPAQFEMLVAFSDPSTEQRHHGGLYQAGSWLYTGQTKSGGYHYRDADGHRIGKKRPWRIAKEQGYLPGERPTDAEARIAREQGWTRVEGERKYRYVKPRTRRAQRGLRLPVLEYPKPDPARLAL
jgi:hypothetical protein